MLLLSSLRGNLFLYQGEELGLPQADVPFERLQDPEAIANWPETKGRDGTRTPMPWTAKAAHGGFSDAEPWLPVDPAHLPLAVDRQETEPGSMLHLTRRLVALRKRLPALRTGSLAILEAPESLFAFTRGAGDERLLCVFNLGSEAADWPLGDDWRIVAQVGETAPRLQPLAGFIAERAG
jgi:alpha-glucosidase